MSDARSSRDLTYPPLVGRTEELASVAAALAHAAQGQGGAIVLSGEAGIGKTRLAREALTLAQARGFLALEGRAYPMEGRLAYGLFVDAVGSFLRSLDRARLMALVSGLSDLGRLFGGLPLPAPESVSDAALEKTRLFEALTRLVERLAQTTPIALLLDDLHWADPASLELLHYLARNLASQRVLVLITYRAEEAGETRGLALLLASLRRAGLADELVVPRLRPQAVAQLAHSFLGNAASDELLALLEARAAGTPLFINELLRALQDAGQLVRSEGGWTRRSNDAAILPQGVRDLILGRLDRLDATERRVVDLLAVGGASVLHEVVRAAGALAEEALPAAVHRLRVAGFVAEELHDRGVVYHLTHPLIQEVAYAELPEMARRLMHAAFARALEALHPGDVDQLAFHYRGAGPAVDGERALEVLLRAGEQAREIYAYEQAARHFEAALRLVREGQRHSLLPLLLERLGEAWDRVGEGGAAVALWTEAIAEYARGSDVPAIVRLHRAVAATEWERGRFEAAQQALAAGLAALAGRSPSEELADLLYLRVSTLRRQGERAGLAAAVGELRAVAEQLNLSRALAQARLAEAELHDVRGEVRAAREQSQLALAAAEAAGDPLLIYRVREALLVLALSLGDHRSAHELAGHNLAIAGRLGTPTLQSRAHTYLAMAHWLAGAWDEALGHSERSVLLARRVGRPRGIVVALIVRIMILAVRGNLAEAEVCLAAARGAYGERPAADRDTTLGIDLAEALLALERGDVPRARALAAGLAPGWAAGRQPIGAALLAAAQVGAGEAEAALATARTLAQHDQGEAAYAEALAARVAGLAHQALGQPAAALASLARAVELFAGLEMPFEAARARLEWAAARAPQAPEAAADAVRESLAVFEQLGARSYIDRARGLLRRLGVRPPPAHRPRPSGGPLSRRELEVARFVAEGLSNAAIAARLVISQRTVTTHLERIYSRLGITSRAELARYVIEAGMASPASEIT
jgi:DNA-binding CsgD family transcriptional regulator/tetratricopeptide (TPR) repeat protein